MNLRIFGILLFAAFTGAAGSAGAIELHQIEFKTGTDGLRRNFLNVRNNSPQALSCHANLAHWYSLDVLSIEPKVQGIVELWFDPDSGAFILLNEKQENMPVERLWCGVKGQAYATRSTLPLDASDVAGARTVNCVWRDTRIFCE